MQRRAFQETFHAGWSAAMDHAARPPCRFCAVWPSSAEGLGGMRKTYKYGYILDKFREMCYLYRQKDIGEFIMPSDKGKDNSRKIFNKQSTGLFTRNGAKQGNKTKKDAIKAVKQSKLENSESGRLI